LVGPRDEDERASEMESGVQGESAHGAGTLQGEVHRLATAAYSETSQTGQLPIL
jgi:hypothetical protein